MPNECFNEILKWSESRPVWQRDALRRLATKGRLSDGDVCDLTEICKGVQHGSEYFTEGHVSDVVTNTMPVSLVSITHQNGVNALADNQTMNFYSSGLTVVYGENGAGKTGYTRILKKVCRARGGQEEILGNVFLSEAPLDQVVIIKYKVGDKLLEWSGKGVDDFISRVSVFDTQCAAVYLSKKTEVAFRPFGLDMFDKLVDVCKAVKLRLESEKNVLPRIDLSVIRAQIPDGTAVANFLSNLSSRTGIDEVQVLTRLSSKEEAKLALLEKSLLDSRVDDPKNLTQRLTMQAESVRALARHLKEVEDALSAQALFTIFYVRDEVRLKKEEAKQLRETTFSSDMLVGTGSDSWKTLWEAARRFSQESAYLEKKFPVVENGAHCVLCQQDLDHTAVHRLKQFEDFVASMTEHELQRVRQNFENLRNGIAAIKIANETSSERINGIRAEYEVASKSIESAMAANERRRQSIMIAFEKDEDITVDCQDMVTVSREVEALATQIDERIKALQVITTDEVEKSKKAEMQELRARKLLAKYEQMVLDEIECKKKCDAYDRWIKDTDTTTITKKSADVTKKVVSARLKQSFKNELRELSFNNAVELREVGGEGGKLYHQLVFERASSFKLPQVISEGEQRCLSIAAFFAELTIEDKSGIVFDDPVSSLDHKWREAVAKRLAKEAKTRQVIVFTHDAVFLLYLKKCAEELEVRQSNQHVYSFSGAVGRCEDKLPWIAMNVAARIGDLKDRWHGVDKVFRSGDRNSYERELKNIYNLLRESWERATEEVLLNGVVERFGYGIHTQKTKKIFDILQDDLQTLDAAMTKCSKFHHDSAPANPPLLPKPEDLKTDIETLENWVGKIRKRRKSPTTPTIQYQ